MIKKAGLEEITLLYIFYIIQILRILYAGELLSTPSSRDDFILENIKN